MSTGKPTVRRRQWRNLFREVQFDVSVAPAQQRPSSRSRSPEGTASSDPQVLRPRQIKSRSGCEPCKKSRVKCDEGRPACLRCQRREITCTGNFEFDAWQTERPWLYNPHKRTQDIISLMEDEPLTLCTSREIKGHCYPIKATPENDLLRHWFDNACAIMVMVPQQRNPLSYSISSYLQRSRALRHSIQCISQAHLVHFSDSELADVLEERSRALASLRLEIEKVFADRPSNLHQQQLLWTSLLSSLLLGITSGWVNTDLSWGHFLVGARQVVSLALTAPSMHDPVSRYSLGLYLYWEGVSSHTESCKIPQTRLEQQEQRQDRQARLQFLRGIADQQLAGCIHPVTGLASGVFPLMWAAGSYYRSVAQGCPDDPYFVDFLEEELAKWEPVPPPDLSERSQKLLCLAEGYRSLTRLLLYQAMSASQARSSDVDAVTVDPLSSWKSHVAVARAMDVLAMIPAGDSLITSVGPFIVVAGSQLSHDQVEARDLVRSITSRLTNYSRVQAFSSALKLVRAVWEQQHSGRHLTWLEMMLQKDMKLSVA